MSNEPTNGNIKQSYVLHVMIGIIGVLLVSFFTYYATTQATADMKRDDRITVLESDYAVINIQLARIEDKLGIPIK